MGKQKSLSSKPESSSAKSFLNEEGLPQDEALVAAQAQKPRRPTPRPASRRRRSRSPYERWSADSGELRAGPRNRLLATDVTELRRTEADLKESQKELRDLSARLLTVAEEEGRRIARELHDSLGSRLAKVNMQASELEQLLSLQPVLAEKIRRIKEEINFVAKATHDLSRLLHPVVLSQLGLETALESECFRYSRQFGVAVNFSAERMPESLPDEIALCLYRVAQEGLENIRKHAQAKRASVTLTTRGHEIIMELRDFGRGFDLKAARGRGGLGFVSMEERVRLVRGHVSIHSAPGEGSEVEVRVPISEDMKSEAATDSTGG